MGHELLGAGRGLGRAIAEAFGREGARVVLVARTLSQLEETAAAVRDAGGDALVFAADVTAPESAQAAVDTAMSEASSRLKEEARRLGADAVVGVSVAMSSVAVSGSSGSAELVLMSGGWGRHPVVVEAVSTTPAEADGLQAVVRAAGVTQDAPLLGARTAALGELLRTWAPEPAVMPR